VRNLSQTNLSIHICVCTVQKTIPRVHKDNIDELFFSQVHKESVPNLDGASSLVAGDIFSHECGPRAANTNCDRSLNRNANENENLDHKNAFFC